MNTWTQAGLKSDARFLSGTLWRAVEHQYTVATRKLVDTRDESDLLEDILETGKPSYPAGTEHLHYLLKTPFRYHPKRLPGSRFGRPYPGQGVFYGSEQQRTVLAEFAFSRLRFFSESPGTPLPRNPERLTLFTVNYASKQAIDLTAAPFNKHAAVWLHPADYAPTQAFADIARKAGIDTIRYQSVRDKEKGNNVALLSFTAFKSKKPGKQQTWFLTLAETEVNFERVNAGDGEVVVLSREGLGK